MAKKGLQLKQVMLAVGVSLALTSVAYATGNGDSSYDDHDQQSCKGIPGTCNNQPGKPWWAKFPGNHGKGEHQGGNHDDHSQHGGGHQTPPPQQSTSQQQQQSQQNGDVNGTVKGNNEIHDSGNGYGGVATATSHAGDQSSSVNVHTDSSSEHHYIHMPAMPGLPPIMSQQGEVKQVMTTCGPLQQVVKARDVNGVFHGAVSTTEFPLTIDDKLEPYKDANGNVVRYHKETEPDGSIRMYGHQAIITTTPLNTSGARQVSLGGFGSGGGGQAGVGGSGSMNQLVTTIKLIDCEHSVYKPVSKEVAQEVPKVQLQTGEIQVPKKVTRSCYRVTDDHPLSKKPAGMAICPSKGGVRSFTTTEPGPSRDIITEVQAGKKKYLVDDATGKFMEQELK